MNAAFRSTQFFTMCGPDATKIGTQLSLSASMLGDSEIAKLAIGHPQEYIVSGCKTVPNC